MKLKVLNPFIDLLLACCTALLEDETRGIQVSNIPELAEALMQDGIVISGTRVPSDNRRSFLERESVAPLGLDHTQINQALRPGLSSFAPTALERVGPHYFQVTKQ